MADTSLVFNIVAKDRASGTLDKLGGSLKKLVVGAAALKFGKDVIGNASDLNETLNKSNVIFGKNAKAVEQWASGGAKNLGLSKAAALESAASFGNMFQQLGFAGDAATKMSERVVTLSADLGSFNNLPTAEVSDMMSAAFRGEFDSLQRLIPNINAARVQQQAMADTGKTNAASLTAQEKAAAVLAIVTKDGSAANGDFARTSGGLANQQKILQATYEDITAQIGTELLPVMTKLSGELLAVIGFVQRNQAVIVPLVGTLGGLTLAVWGVNKAVAGAKATQAAFNTVLGLTGKKAEGATGAASKMGGVLSSGGLWGVAAITAVGILGMLAAKHAEARQRVDDLTAAIQADSGALAENTHAAAANSLEKSGALKAAQALGISLGTLTDAYLGNAAAVAAVNAVVDKRAKDLPERITDESKAQEELSGNLAKVSGAVARGNVETDAAVAKSKRLASASGEVSKGQTDQAAATTDAATAAADASAKVETYKDALDRLNGVNITAEQQQIALKKAFISTTSAIDKSSKVSLDERSALLDLASQANSTAGAIKDQTGSQKKANAVLIEARHKFMDTATAMGISRDRAKELADKLLGIPKDTKARVAAPGLTDALSRASILLATLHQLSDRGWSATITGGSGVVRGGRGAGGRSSPASSAAGGHSSGGSGRGGRSGFAGPVEVRLHADSVRDVAGVVLAGLQGSAGRGDLLARGG